MLLCRSLYVGGVAAKVLSGYHPGYLPQLIQRKLFGGGYVCRVSSELHQMTHASRSISRVRQLAHRIIN